MSRRTKSRPKSMLSSSRWGQDNLLSKFVYILFICCISVSVCRLGEQVLRRCKFVPYKKERGLERAVCDLRAKQEVDSKICVVHHQLRVRVRVSALPYLPPPPPPPFLHPRQRPTRDSASASSAGAHSGEILLQQYLCFDTRSPASVRCMRCFCFSLKVRTKLAAHPG